jgi:hypothetical protein
MQQGRFRATGMMIHHPHHLRRSSVAPLITGQVGQFSIAHLGNFSKVPKLMHVNNERAAAGQRFVKA